MTINYFIFIIILKVKNLKKFSEKFFHLVRDNFPDVGENETLFSLLSEIVDNKEKSVFAEQIQQENKISEFKSFIYSKIEYKKNTKTTDKSVEELLNIAGYDFYICKTIADVKKFEKYYMHNEKLCTFNNIQGRLNDYFVFWIVKKNINNIQRSAIPSRQDEYGTSCCSIQISKNKKYISIKNRYNHTVSNPDNTFNNNLENIIEGLTEAFNNEFNFEIGKNNNNSDFELNNFIYLNDKFHYFNNEINGIYYGINKIVQNGEVIYIDSNSQILIDYFIYNNKTKQLSLFDKTIQDCFVDIDNINIIRDFDFVDKNKNNIVIDKHNRIISLYFNIVETIGNNFCFENKNITAINMPVVETIGNNFCFCNKNIKEINMPIVETIGNYFCFYNENITEINMPVIETIGNDFCFYNKNITKINMPIIETIGNNFCFCNKNIKSPKGL